MNDPAIVARAFRVVAIAEALSWTGLLIGMFVKWVLGTSEVGVQVFGPIHGALFVAYVVVTLWTARLFRWDLRTTIVGLLASIPPLTTIWFERHAARTGRLGAVTGRAIAG
jgi:integral membrane protein